MKVKKFYCSKKVNPKTKELEFTFKEANKKEIIVFKTLDNAISHLKSLRIDATMWIKENNVFVSGVKVRVGENPEEEVKVEIIEYKPKEKKTSKETKKLCQNCKIELENLESKLCEKCELSTLCSNCKTKLKKSEHFECSKCIEEKLKVKCLECKKVIKNSNSKICNDCAQKFKCLECENEMKVLEEQKLNSAENESVNSSPIQNVKENNNLVIVPSLQSENQNISSNVQNVMFCCCHYTNEEKQNESI